ncbi:tripartite tricarboxylate transporter permease [Haloechinothrix sp. YIM 98757]|uniref:Tripartite tricarboxylate transporter permease n=1 Tax=Haloechinothrix aidingensis TaxID=2752311 RepID=A0A838AAB7_9PSEU|nr:tripartite tricarboxylate transporter permease [Haloechinothrix aidingensis]MBA0126182.1 tripartite tricarboxylate transporter permease [Haloechinothrix aidingensis]
MDFVIEGFGMLTPGLLAWMCIGVVICQLVVIIPGLSGTLLLALILPFLYTMDPVSAIGLLIGAAATAGTGNTITSVLFGVPGNVVGVATLLDGYPMAQRGEASKAILAGLVSSAAGGIIGALALAMLLPFARPVAMAIGPPELFALILVALLFMAFAGEGSMMKGLVAGGMGLLLAFIGQETSQGALRYTFGRVELWDGISIATFAIGIFGIAEMLDLMAKGGSIARGGRASYRSYRILQSIRDVLRAWRTVLQSSAVAVGVGILPGIGGSSAQFMAYSLAKKTSRRGKEFGKGRIEGVIAADSSVNASDAAALAPTLGLGVPGSPITALVLSGLIIIGIQPGPDLVAQEMGTLWLVVLLLILANLVAVALCVWAARPLAMLTLVPSAYLVPLITAFAVFGVVEADGNLLSVPIVLALGMVGFLMKRHGYSRATMIIGFVLADLLERNFILATNIHGPGFLLRPVPLAILGSVAGALAAVAVYKRRTSTTRKVHA